MTDKPFLKNWASPPGDTILDAIEELGLTQRDLAVRLGVTNKHVNELIKGKVNITADMALKLESVLGEPAAFWMKRDADYRLALARKNALKHAKTDGAQWLTLIGYREIARLGWVKKSTTLEDKLMAAMSFFGVGSIEAWHDYVESLCPAFRDTGRFQRKEGPVAAWLRKAELDAQRLATEPFDKGTLLRNLGDIRGLTLEDDPNKFLPRLEALCGAAGVALAIVPAPRGFPVSGATCWLKPDKALLALSLRHKSNDHFWFALFHELGHLIKHGKRLTVIEGLDGLDPKLEDAANVFAANQLIPPDSDYEDFKRGMITERTIKTFASRIGLAPGIVVGRLQKDKIIPWNSVLNQLKVRYAWANA